MSILNLRSITKGFSPNSVAVDNVDLEVKEGELLALTGESGCGKTTLLRLIAGLEQPDRGSVEIQNQVVSNNSMSMPPQKRAVGLVFQDYALFPHMTVNQNISFGLSQWTSSDSRNRIREVLDMVNLSGLDQRYPHQLSGGQQQRVAIARALAPRPKILLLDEPFSNLDTILKHQVRQELAVILQRSNTTVILVTHDVQDALSMANRIAVLKAGKLLQVDLPKLLYQKPADSYTASFFGKANLVPVSSAEAKMIIDQGILPEQGSTDNTGLWCLRPEHIRVFGEDSDGIDSEIISIDYLGGYRQLKVKVGDLELWCHHSSGNYLEIGQRIKLVVDLEQIHYIQDQSSSH